MNNFIQKSFSGGLCLTLDPVKGSCSDIVSNNEKLLRNSSEVHFCKINIELYIANNSIGAVTQTVELIKQSNRKRIFILIQGRVENDAGDINNVPGEVYDLFNILNADAVIRKGVGEKELHFLSYVNTYYRGKSVIFDLTSSCNDIKSLNTSLNIISSRNSTGNCSVIIRTEHLAVVKKIIKMPIFCYGDSADKEKEYGVVWIV